MFLKKIERLMDLGFFSTPSKYIFCIAKNSPCGCAAGRFFKCTLRGVSRLAKTGMSTFFIVTTLNQIYALPWQNRGRSCEKYKVKTCPVLRSCHGGVLRNRNNCCQQCNILELKHLIFTTGKFFF